MLGKYLQANISPQPILAVGTTTLRQTMAILARCNLLLYNDSGIMHLGAALDVSLVALFGPQSPAKFGPWGKKCRVPLQPVQTEILPGVRAVAARQAGLRRGDHRGSGPLGNRPAASRG